ncbi:MAG TPA: hypothetical protein VGL66_13335 [Caulobacteraceae bacterium]|jgi:hypothetical protein
MREGLKAAKVVQTLERLHARIRERFPDAGLTQVAQELVDIAKATSARARRVSEPFVLLRAAVGVVIVATIGLLGWVVIHSPLQNLTLSPDITALAQGLNAVVNLLVIAAGSTWFLMSLEQRLKRRRALKDLHELRSFAHVIDMHQLTKDPTVVLSKQRTSSSPAREMTRFQLTRYLEYCAEMLALIGKLAALYSEYTRDPQIVGAVNDVENLSTDLGRKIWQKITILSDLDESQAKA